MGWKGALRSMGSAVRQMEREAARRQRELEKQQKQYEKMQELERAAYEVEVYENYIDRMNSIHRDCESCYDWREILKQEPPEEPKKGYGHESEARQHLDKYKPNFFEKLFKLDAKKKRNLELKIESSRNEDEKEYNDRLKQYQQKLEDYNDLQILTKNVLEGNLEYYKKAVEEINPLSEISEIGSSVEFLFQSPTRIKATLHIHDEKVIPRQAKSLLKSGKLTIKDIPQGKYNELYQDYVCSSSLRVGRELFALLPVQEIVVTAKGNILNQSTGRMEEQPLLSVSLVRETMSMINFESIDPSECMKNFKHNMGFKKSQGMSPVSEID